MRHLAILLLAVLPLAAAADPCQDEVAALYDGGPLDPFAQPPYRYETAVTAADGSLRYEYVTTFDTPLRSMNGMKGQKMYLAIGNRTWEGPGPDGPWTELPSSLPDDMEGFQRRVRDQMAANVADAECLGTVQRDGQDFTAYRFTTRTGPNDDGTFFGGEYTVFVDPATGRLAVQEVRAQVAHYLTEPGTDLSVSVYTYDPSIALAAPE